MELNATTLVFETINFVVLVAILWRLLYRPLRRAVEGREAAIAERQEKAEQSERAAKQLQRKWKKRHGDLAREAERAQAEAEERAVTRQEEILARAREAAAVERRKASALIAAERAEAETYMRELAIETGADLAGRVMLRLAPEALESALAEELKGELGSSLAAAGAPPTEQGLVLSIRAARSPADDLVRDLREHCEDLLEMSFEGSVAVEVDPTLRAGWIVRIGDHVFDASLDGYLRTLTAAARAVAPEPERPHA